MSRTATRSRNGSAPSSETAPAPAVAPEPAPAPAPAPAPEPLPAPALLLDLDLASEEEIGKAKRVFQEVIPRVPIGDGRHATVRREIRADGSEGPHLCTIVRINDKEPVGSDRRENFTDWLASDVRAWVQTTRAAGVKFV